MGQDKNIPRQNSGIKEQMMTPEKGGIKNDGMGAGGPSPTGEKLSQLLSGGLDKARD
jgi:hypothetical protein